MSPSIIVQNGPATTRVRSITRKPSSGGITASVTDRLAGIVSARISHFIGAIAFCMGVVAIAAAQTVDPQTLGPKVGERVPEFSLMDQHGATRSLKSTFGPKGAVLVFFRSADW
jgi:hypothetical protein